MWPRTDPEGAKSSLCAILKAVVRLPPSLSPKPGPNTGPAGVPRSPEGVQSAKGPEASTTPVAKAPLEPPPAPSASLPAGRETASVAAVRKTLAELTRGLDDAAGALPDAGRAALKSAVAKSAERVLVSLDLGRISVDEATRGARMLAEMTDALVAIEHGRVQVQPSEHPVQEGLKSYDVKTTTGDELRVTVRPFGNEQGEARLKLESVADDGKPLAQEDRLMIRFDLEGSSPKSPRSGALARLDLQFGKERFNREDPREKLNKRIHGVLLDDQGQPVMNRGGNTVPDHHFRHGVPGHLDDADAFSRFTSAFLDELEGYRKVRASE